MIQLKVNELLKKQKKTKYWFVKNMEGGYQSLTRMMNNETNSIKFDTLEKCVIYLIVKLETLLSEKKERKKIRIEVK